MLESTVRTVHDAQPGLAQQWQRKMEPQGTAGACGRARRRRVGRYVQAISFSIARAEWTKRGIRAIAFAQTSTYCTGFGPVHGSSGSFSHHRRTYSRTSLSRHSNGAARHTTATPNLRLWLKAKTQAFRRCHHRARLDRLVDVPHDYRRNLERLKQRPRVTPFLPQAHKAKHPRKGRAALPPSLRYYRRRQCRPSAACALRRPESIGNLHPCADVIQHSRHPGTMHSQ